ncbi:MAG: hypothetical protein ACR2OU_05485 [Thermomicrobiales bacterium]
MLAALLATGDLDWSLQYLNATVIRAHAQGAVIKPSAAVKAAFGPRFTSVARAAANRSPGR